MRNFLPLIFLFISFNTLAQSTISAGGERISAYTPDRDTLWLVNKEIGRLIAYSWEISNDNTPKPVIVLVDKLPQEKISTAEVRYARAPKRRRIN